MKIIIHRGTHQIGGCVTEIKSGGKRILIDVGSNLSDNDELESTQVDIAKITKRCDGVFITHYHGDHVGEFKKIAKDVPVYMGETAKKIFLSLQKVLKKRKIKAAPELVEKFKTFKHGEPIEDIAGIKITPISVDHSAFDAYMFLIECENKKILHTGDFRMHGVSGDELPDRLREYAPDVDVLITEGTMLSRFGEDVRTEGQLGEQAREILSKHKNVFLLCSSTNIDTIAQFYNAMENSRKPFVVAEDDFQLAILGVVAANTDNAFYDFTKVYPYAIHDWEKGRLIWNYKLMDWMAEQGFCMLITANGIGEHALMKFPDSLLIYSMWNGYLDKKHSAFDEHKYTFIENAKARGTEIRYDLHTSGHATPKAIEDVFSITNPGVVIPIHGEDPKNFETLNIPKEKIVILNDGEIYDVTTGLTAFL